MATTGDVFLNEPKESLFVKSKTTSKSKTMSGRHSLKVFAFGGLDEVGMNMLGLQVDQDVVLLDCGVSFQDVMTLGLEYVVPNFSALHTLKDMIRAVVFTHGHEDHIGAAGLFCREFPKVPMYAGALTKDLIMARSDEYPHLRSQKIKIYEPGKSFKIGNMEIHPVSVTHSIPNAHGLVIDTAAGRVIFSGDFRYEYDNFKKFSRQFKKEFFFANFLDRPILCYFGDSTNVEASHELITETMVAQNLEKMIANQSVGLLVITLFSSNMERVGAVLSSAQRLGKKVVLCGRSVKRYLEIAQRHRVVPRFRDLILDDRDVFDYPRHRLVAIATGSQAEPKSALARMAYGMHRTIKLEEGDCVVMSSKFIPGNERPISRMINALMFQGVDVVTDRDAPIHTSGHAFEEESVLTLEAISPKFFIPIHGEYHHMVHHAKLARSIKRKGPEHVVVLRNGMGVEISEDGFQMLPPFDSSKWTYDFGTLMPMVSPIISQRKRMARHGLILCSLTPTLHMFGLGVLIDDECLSACEAYLKVLETTVGGRKDRMGQMRAFIKRYFRDRFQRRPFVIIARKEFVPYEFP